ncbi:MAG: MBL fold metallo-hydrolase [Oscillospiraceae bacterium]|nr:MBL fold metallo-hydrolase [Oscillospiraceae bacterium]
MRTLPSWVNIALSVFLFFIILVAALFGRTLLDTIQINPLATRAITQNVYAIQTGTVNFFLIRGNHGYIAIDTGEDITQAEQELYALGISPQEIVAIFLTHSDSDHTAAISLFPNATLYLSEHEVQMIDGTTNRARGRFLLLSWLMRSNINNPVFPYKFTTLTDHEQIEVDGVLIQGFLTPGHTPGSMSFLVDERYLFTGDAMAFNRNGRAARMIHLSDMNSNQARQSISSIATIQAQYIFTAHHGYSNNLDFVFANVRDN